MPLNVTGILGLAQTIYQGIGAPTNLSVGLISGWITDPNNIGDLNNKLSTSFYVDGTQPAGPWIRDDFGPEEGNIYNLMYQSSYYENLALVTLSSGGLQWITLTEGDTRITRTDPVNLAKQYNQMKNDAFKGICLAINNYNRRVAVPQSVDAAQSASYPTP